MDITFDNKGRFHPDLIKKAKARASDFFRASDVTAAHFVAFKMVRNASADNLIRFASETHLASTHLAGVAVSVMTEGTQGLVCIITIPGKTEAKVREIIQAGPYLTRRKPSGDSPPGVEAEATTPEADQGDAPPAPEAEANAVTPFEDDAALFELAAQVLDDRQKAEEVVRLAKLTLQQRTEDAARIEQEFRAAQQAVSDARTGVEEATHALKQCALRPEVLEALRAAKARLAALANELGI